MPGARGGRGGSGGECEGNWEGASRGGRGGTGAGVGGQGCREKMDCNK
jgi:hypothetical protein